jgi:hypothetical protein
MLTCSFYLALPAGYSSKAPFVPINDGAFSQSILGRGAQPDQLTHCRTGQAMVMETVAARQDDDDPHDPDAGAGSLLSIDDFVKPADWPEGKNW